jgi:hypothetical protein
MRLSLVVVVGQLGEVCRRVLNCHPQAEGYSYVNLVVATTVGSDGTGFVPTRRVTGGA